MRRLFLFFLLIFFGCDANPDGCGWIKSTNDELPISNAKIVLYFNSMLEDSTYTDSNDYFTIWKHVGFVGEIPSSTLKISKEGFTTKVFNLDSLNVTQNLRLDSLHLSLSPISN